MKVVLCMVMGMIMYDNDLQAFVERNSCWYGRCNASCNENDHLYNNDHWSFVVSRVSLKLFTRIVEVALSHSWHRCAAVMLSCSHAPRRLAQVCGGDAVMLSCVQTLGTIVRRICSLALMLRDACQECAADMLSCSHVPHTPGASSRRRCSHVPIRLALV